jgi:osmotically-inducible protein OsmY
VKVTVEKRWVTLDGQLHWYYQKEAAKDAVKNLLGVRSVWDNITIKSETQDQIEKQDIESALRRNWSIGDKIMNVEVSSHNVKLIGKVNSW